MLDISSTTHTATCANTTTTNTLLRNVLNEINNYRGTAYINPQKQIAAVVAACLEELGFAVTVVNTTNYYNHIVLNDYSEDVCLQVYNSGASVCNLAFLYPRHISPITSVAGTFNSGTACRATLRMVGAGPGKTKTLLLLGSTAVPALNCMFCIYFTEAKYLPTGEVKRAIVIQNGVNYCFFIYDDDWTFLPGFDSALTTAVSLNNYWHNLSPSSGNRYSIDPFSSYKFFQEQNNFPEITVASHNGLWEFVDIIYNPYGQITEEDVSEAHRYVFTAGNIYQIGNKKYLCNAVGTNYLLYRVE